MDEEDSDPCPPADETALLAEAVARHGAPLAALHADWLGPQLDSEAGTAGVLAALQARFDAPGFARSCGRADADADAAAPPPPLLPPPPGPRVDVTSRSWWSWSRAALGLARPGAPPPPPPPNDPAALAEALLAAPPDPEPEPLTSYVLIEHEDALDALATFIARFVSSHPSAADLPPAALQKALSAALRDVRRRRVTRLWEWARGARRCAAWAAGAASLAADPWLVRALCAALWTACRLAAGLW